MHEMPVVESILDIVIRHAAINQVQRVVSITLVVGDMSDLENEWLQHYFDFFSRETPAEGAVLKISRAPVELGCAACGHTIMISRQQIAEAVCPVCQHSQFNVLSGHEYYIKEMEVI